MSRRLRSTIQASEPAFKRTKDAHFVASPPESDRLAEAEGDKTSYNCAATATTIFSESGPLKLEPKYEIWRNPKKSINSYGEPFSAWATFVPVMPAWFIVWNEGSPDDGGGRKNKWAPAKPSGFTERHVVTEEMLTTYDATEVGDDALMAT